MPEAQVAVSWTNEEKKCVSLPLHLRFREYCLTLYSQSSDLNAWTIKFDLQFIPAIVGWQPISVQNNRKELAVLDL